MSEQKKKGVRFHVQVHYQQGCAVSSDIMDVDAEKDVTDAICNAVKIHLRNFDINGKIEKVNIDLQDF